MSSVSPPPFYEILAGDDGKPKLPWTIFFQQMFDGDPGSVWTPTFQNLSITGTPTITGRFYKLSRYLTYFSVNIIPATNTSSVAGTTYIDSFPLDFTNDGVVFALAGNLGDGPGQITASTNRIYTPEWTNVSVPVTLIGIGEAS